VAGSEKAREHLQMRLMAALLHGDTLSRYRALVRPEVFASPRAQAAVRTMLRLVDAMGRMPGRSTLLLEVSREHEDADEIIPFVKQAMRLDPTEVERIYVPDLERLVRLSHMQRCAVDVQRACADGDLDMAYTLLSRAQQRGTRYDSGSYDEEDPDERYDSGDATGRGELIPTMWKEYNDVYKGGLARGENHVIVGPPKRGKTRLAINLASHFWHAGYVVVYVSLEVGRRLLYARLDSVLTGMPPEDLVDSKRRKHLKHVKSQYAERGGSLHVAKFPPNRLTMADLAHFLRSMDRAPDVVVLDYFELMDFTSGGGKEWNYYEMQGRMYADFIAMMEDGGSVGIGLTQPTKGQEREISGADQISGSAGKLAHCTSMTTMYIEGKKLDDLGIFDLLVGWNRVGPCPRYVPLQVDHVGSNMQISIRDEFNI